MKFPEIWIFTLAGWYKPWQIESDFQSELLGLLRYKYNYICFHPADVGYSNKFLDVHFITPQGNCHWLELKKIQWDTFNVKNFEDDQITLLRELHHLNPEIARVWIYSVKNNDYKILTFPEIWDAQSKIWSVKIFNNKKK